MDTAKRKLMSESPKYKVGDIIVVTTEYKTIPGVKDLKPGSYEILDFRPSSIFSRIQYDMSYEFKSTRKNSSHRYSYSQQWLEENSHLKQQ